MDSFVIVFLGMVLLYLAYHVYGTKISKLLDISDDNKTPARTMEDGIDYVPTGSHVVFGHHFSSIAGAGPILGPVAAAALFGWVPAFLWIVIGSIFIGGVHDFTSLVASMRHKGKSIASVAGNVMSKRAQVIFASFIWLTLVLIVAVFAVVAAKALINTPEIVLPTVMLIPIAVFIGLLHYKYRMDSRTSTIIGLILLFAFIIVGLDYPISLSADKGLAFNYWVVILLGYALVASVLPVWTLLQPRDYLASYVLFIGLGLGIVGIAAVNPPISTPALISFNSAQGFMWPILFITIACGAISGFHSLVSSGTSSKQIKKESDSKKIGYGSMLVEGLLAIFALLAVTAGLAWVSNDPSVLSYQDFLNDKNPIGAFGSGYGHFVEPFFGLALGTVVGVMIVKTFVMTTLDTASRLGRFVGSELFGSNGLGIKAMDNRYISTLVLVVGAGALALSNNWLKIWPVFGAANQLIAALALFVVTTWLVGMKKPSKYTLYPAIFMLLTTIAALVILTMKYIPEGNYLLAGTAILLLVLAILVVIETASKWRMVKAGSV